MKKFLIRILRLGAVTFACVAALGLSGFVFRHFHVVDREIRAGEVEDFQAQQRMIIDMHRRQIAGKMFELQERERILESWEKWRQL